MRVKGHKLVEIERWGVESGYRQAVCKCGWRHENYFTCSTNEQARAAYRRHLEQVKAA